MSHIALAARLAAVAAVAAPLLLSACATVRGTPLEMTIPSTPRAAEFVATGELRTSYGKSAAFDAWHIRGPRVNLTRAADGSWDGTGGPDMQGLHLEVKPGEVRGAGVSLGIEKMADGFVEVGGLFFLDRYSIRISSQRITGSTHGGRCSFDLKRLDPTRFGGELACGMEITRIDLELLGEAARGQDPILPQVALALVAVMP
jgi:hypothetical protein